MCVCCGHPLSELLQLFCRSQHKAEREMMSSFHKARRVKLVNSRWRETKKTKTGKVKKEPGRNLAGSHRRPSAPPQRSLHVVNKGLMRDQ